MSHLDYRPTYRRNLPHIQPPGATLFITFRLAGSLPEKVITEWRAEREWLNRLSTNNPSYYEQLAPQFERAWFSKFERILDGCEFGPLWLQDDRVAEIVKDSLHYRDGKVFRLDAFSIMPNHVHAVVKPLPIFPATDPDPTYHSIASIMQSLKGYTSFKCNRCLDKEGEFWAHESYDHWIRDADEWQRVVAYVLNNPVKAQFVSSWRAWKWNFSRFAGGIN